MMNHTDLPHWLSLWHALDARGEAAATWHARLLAAYGDATRHYHNRQHLEECLVEFDAVRSQLKVPALVEAALWFHDVVYDARASNNEEDSAQLAVWCLEEAGVGADAIDTVRQLILSTKTHDPGTSDDAAFLIDIDLAILGQPAARFWQYEDAIRAEYAWVPAPTFAQKRAAILDRFLERPSLYRTEPFRRRYESTARANLRAALQRLRSPAP